MRNRATTSLKTPKLRQSWSKYNLYNLARQRNPNTVARTFFQQKWTARTMARAYHGEQIPESHWARMFSRRIRSVVPMSAARLARDDGSAASAGRGQGLDPHPSEKTTPFKRTPFMQMTFAPLERRLDVAVFRALFASSTRQARQFVIHGAVTVNSKKMRYPGYLLNPGDLFQVDPERVMFATGAPKDKHERRAGRVARRQSKKQEEPGSEESAAAEQKEEKPEEAEEKDDAEMDPRETLKSLMNQAKTILSTDKEALPAKRKQELRGFQKAVRRILSRSESSTVLADNLEGQFSQLTSLLKAKKAAPKDSKNDQPSESSPARRSSNEADEPSTDDVAESAEPGEALTEAFKKATLNEGEINEDNTSELTDDEFEVLKRALTQLRDNPIDNTKPYATPWRPRDYMGAFAFIPRYLEVNQNICAAVYVRHPVARPGFSEVPTPFNEETGTAAFTWYLRRR